MITKSIIISLTITGIIAGMNSTSFAAMTHQKNNNNNTKAINAPSSRSSSCLFQKVKCQRVPSDMHRYIAELSETLPPKNLDLGSPAHIKSIQALLKLKLEVKNKAFGNSFISGVLGNIQSITIPNNFVINQKKFDGLLGFLGQLKNLTEINVQETDITDQQLMRLLNTVNKKKITYLNLKSCHSLLNPIIDDFPVLVYLDLSDCTKLQSFKFINLPALVHLDLSYTEINDAKLANIFNLGNFMETLQELNLEHCELLQTPTFDGLLALTHLNLSDCTGLQNPMFGKLPALIELNLTWCCQIKMLSLSSLSALANLSLIWCCSLRQVTLSKAVQHRHIEQQQEYKLIRFVYV